MADEQEEVYKSDSMCIMLYPDEPEGQEMVKQVGEGFVRGTGQSRAPPRPFRPLPSTCLRVLQVLFKRDERGEGRWQCAEMPACLCQLLLMCSMLMVVCPFWSLPLNRRQHR